MKQFLSLFFISLFLSAATAQSCLSGWVIVDNDVSCNEGFDGQATAFSTDGTPPYTYLWDASTGSQFTATATGLVAGTGIVTITDALGCSGAFSYTITEPPFLTATITETFPGSCTNSCDAGAMIDVVGGVPPYTYLWSDGSTGQNNDFLCTGTYTITITDSNICTAVLSWISFDPSPISITLTTTDETCLGSDGTISADVVGGTPPYSYLWATGSITQSISGLGAGIYTVTIVDANNCLTTGSAQIFSAISLSLTATEASCDMADGTATVVVNYGTTNPTYTWNNGQTTPTATGLAQGWYSVTVEDTPTNCVTHRNIYVDEDNSCKVLINGYVRNDDVNQDCIVDASTNPLTNRLLRLWDGSQLISSTFTDSVGYYEFVVDNGTYDLELYLNDPDSLICPSSSPITIVAPTDGNTYSQDFYTAYLEIQDVGVFLSKGPARPGFFQYYTISYRNYGGDTLSGNITFIHDSLLVDFNAGGSEDSYDATTYTALWSYTDLAPNESRKISFNLRVPPTTPLGTTLTTMVSIDPLIGDQSPSNNQRTCYRTVTGSYDPNDKQNLTAEDPFGGDISPDILTYHYQIRFQNTGTDTAFTVVVKDELDDNFFDLTTIRPVASSHAYSMDMEDNNTLVFFFENIMLPDSNVNEPASNGFIYFTIERLENLPLGTQVDNKAAIYFDFNAPIITNTVTNTLAYPTRIVTPEVLGFNFKAYPNPLQDDAYLDIRLQKKEQISIEILDVQGRLISLLINEQQLTAGNHQIPLDYKSLMPGVYFIRMKTANHSITRKVLRP